ncbi:EamA family transporter [Tenacibaculum sp. SG-28]|uniref:EamA family transporter n=1 Tax=Tenacibaculum sp. SG-28 TaxID=754426 RepID=UPI0026CF1266
MNKDHTKNIGGLLLATFLISTSGVLGKYIAMPTEVIIWCRAFLAMIFLGIYLTINKVSLAVKSPKHKLPFLLGGILMAIHWVTYFYALKLSNVAIGMLSLFTFPVLIAFLEPLFLKVKFNPIHLFLVF